MVQCSIKVMAGLVGLSQRWVAAKHSEGLAQPMNLFVTLNLAHTACLLRAKEQRQLGQQPSCAR